MYIYVHTYMCMHVCMYLCVYIYIYIHTHTRKQKQHTQKHSDTDTLSLTHTHTHIYTYVQFIYSHKALPTILGETNAVEKAEPAIPNTDEEDDADGALLSVCISTLFSIAFSMGVVACTCESWAIMHSFPGKMVAGMFVSAKLCCCGCCERRIFGSIWFLRFSGAEFGAKSPACGVCVQVLSADACVD